MARLHDYKTGLPIEIDTRITRLLSANPAIDATLIRVEEDGKPKSYLVRDSVEAVTRLFE